MAVIDDTKTIGRPDPSAPTVGSANAATTDTIATTYTFSAPCKISDAVFYQPATNTITVTRLIGGVAGQAVVLLTDSASTSGADLSGRCLQTGDTMTIAMDANVAGTKGYHMQFEAFGAG